MDFEKLKDLVNPGIVIDVEAADEHGIRATNNPGSDNSWKEFTPDKYSNEKELTAAINNAFRPDVVADNEIYAGYK